MASVLDIKNRALGRLGLASLATETDPNASARETQAAWDIARRDVLSLHTWNCVTTRVSIAADPTPPSFGFEQRYKLPTGCLQVAELCYEDGTPLADHIPWTVESGYILTDIESPAFVRYIRDSQLPGEWAPHVASLVAWRLAHEVGPRLIQNAGKVAMVKAEFNSALVEALVRDGKEQSAVQLPPSPWATVRNYG